MRAAGGPLLPRGAGRDYRREARRSIRQCCRAEVSRTVSAPHETEGEMAGLLEVLSRG